MNICKGIALSLMSAFLIATFATPVSAAFVSGDITFSGDFAPTGGTGLGDATGIDFLGDDFEVDDTTGDFALAGIAKDDVGTINDFSFDPFVAVTPLWTIGGFSFDLTTLVKDFQSATVLALSGSGTVSGNSFDATEGIWNLTANTTTGTLFNFSSGTSAIPGGAVVPLPAAAWLFGSALLGFVGLSKRKQA